MATNCRKQRGVIQSAEGFRQRTVVSAGHVEAHLLSTHEAVLLLDVDVINRGPLFGPRLVADASIRTPHHTTLTASHLQDQEWMRKPLTKTPVPLETETSAGILRPVPQRLCLVLQIYQSAHPRY